jgi:hypothetical protein
MVAGDLLGGIAFASLWSKAPVRQHRAWLLAGDLIA